MGQAKQRRLREASAGSIVLETAQRIAHVVQVGAQELSIRQGGTVLAALPADIKSMVVKNLETVGIDAVLRMASRRLNGIVDDGSDHHAIVVTIYNNDLPLGLPSATPIDMGLGEHPDFSDQPRHLTPVAIEDVKAEFRADLEQGIEAMERSGTGKASVFMDPNGHYHLFAKEDVQWDEPAEDQSERDTEPMVQQ